VTTGAGVIAGVSVSHHEADLDELEAADVDSQRAAAADLVEDPAVSEALVLQTCNRVEAYVVTNDPAAGRVALEAIVGDVDASVVRELGHEESLEHLLRVAAGLESLVLGEDQILGQVRDALEDARSVGAIGPVLDDGVTKALHVGERARTETAINEGAVSMASAAVRLAESERDLTEATGLVVGAGEMGRLAAEALAREVDRLLVANRTVPHATHVVDAVAVPGSAVGLDALPAATEAADVVISATGSNDPVFDRETLAAAGDTVVVDIGQPRDVPPGLDDIANVAVRDLEALEAHTAETRRQRQAAAREVEAMVDEALEHLLTQYKRKRADRVISAMYESAERIKAQEVETAVEKLDLDAEGEAVVDAMADAIVSQLLAAPTSSLRDAAAEDDWTTIHTALQLFDPSDLASDADAGAFPDDADAIPEGVREDLPPAVLEQLDD
jgi:glutamyl-tRNA reductase